MVFILFLRCVFIFLFLQHLGMSIICTNNKPIISFFCYFFNWITSLLFSSVTFSLSFYSRVSFRSSCDCWWPVQTRVYSSSVSGWTSTSTTKPVTHAYGPRWVPPGGVVALTSDLWIIISIGCLFLKANKWLTLTLESSPDIPQYDNDFRRVELCVTWSQLCVYSSCHPGIV